MDINVIRTPVTLLPATHSSFDEQDKAKWQALQIKPFQTKFSSLPADFLQQADLSNLHIIQKEGEAIGYFNVDTQFHIRHTFANFDSIAIDHFVVDNDWQAKGIATETIRNLAWYLRGQIAKQMPLLKGAYFLVHNSNTGAYKAFLRGGCEDTQQMFTLDATGQQHILYLPFR